MFYSKVESVSFMFRFCLDRADSLITRNVFYICQMYEINVKNVLVNGWQTIKNVRAEERETNSFK